MFIFNMVCFWLYFLDAPLHPNMQVMGACYLPLMFYCLTFL